MEIGAGLWMVVAFSYVILYYLIQLLQYISLLEIVPLEDFLDISRVEAYLDSYIII